MVIFTDSLTGKEMSYHIDKKLRTKWDKLRDGKLKKQDEDRCYLVDGRERAGKSVFAFQQAKYIDPTFNLERVCFTPDEFLKQIRTAERGQVVVFDEAFSGLSSKGAQSKVNKKIIQALMEVGQRNLIIFIVLPTFFLLEMYAAVLRSNALFHIYKDKKGKRAFRVYNYNKKSLLFNTGKKKGFSYKYPKVRVIGRFFAKYAIDEQAYRKKKGESFRAEKPVFVDTDPKLEEARDRVAKLLRILRDHNKLSYIKIERMVQAYNIDLHRTQIMALIKKVRENQSTVAS